MLASGESFALSLALAFVNAILHYILYRIAVTFILFIKSVVFWIIEKTECLIHRSIDCPAKQDRDDSSDEYVSILEA